MVQHMKTDTVTDGRGRECYLLQIDGQTRSQFDVFVDALKAALELKKAAPSSKVKVREG
jgi:hypothetical protein